MRYLKLKSNYDRYKEIMCDVLSLNVADVEEAAYKKTENWFSLTHLILIDRLEREFELVFSKEEILLFQSFEMGISILTSKGVLDCNG